MIVKILFIKVISERLRQFSSQYVLVVYYEGRPINKLQNGIILLIFKI